MPTQWNSAPAAITTSASRSVIPWSATIAGTMPRAEQQPREAQRDVRDDLDVDPRVVGHLQALALMPATCHQALTCGSPLTGVQEALEPAVAARRRADAHVGQRLGERGDLGVGALAARPWKGPCVARRDRACLGPLRRRLRRLGRSLLLHQGGGGRGRPAGVRGVVAHRAGRRGAPAPGGAPGRAARPASRIAVRSPRTRPARSRSRSRSSPSASNMCPPPWRRSSSPRCRSWWWCSPCAWRPRSARRAAARGLVDRPGGGVVALMGVDVAGRGDELLGAALILVATLGYASRRSSCSVAWPPSTRWARWP